MRRDQSFFHVDLTGLERLEQKLNEMPKRMRNKALRQSLTAATDLMQQEAIRRCPVGKVEAGWMAFLDDPSAPHLKDNIVTQVTVTKQRAWGRVGINYKKVHHGHLVEYGTRPHLMRIGWHVIKHPGTKPPKHPFMRPAFDAKGEEAAQLMANMLFDAAMEVFK